MHFKKVILLCLSIPLCFFASISTQAQNLVSARILSSSGPVEIQRRAQGQAPFQKITYRVNDELLAGDVIKTFAGGRLVLGLTDGSQAIVSEKTVVEIADLSKSPRTIFNLLRGKTRVKIEKLGGRPNPYKVNTPTTVIAVRGTLFDVLVAGNETQVFVHEGEVAVSNFARPDTVVILSPGERTRVQRQQPPEPPSHFRPGRNNDSFKPSGPNGDGTEGRRAENQDGRQPPDGRPDNNQGQAGRAGRDQNDPAQRQNEGGQRPPPPPHDDLEFK